MEYKFTGKVLTLADLEQAAATTNEPLSDCAKESWDYFGFDRKHDWKAVLTGSESVLVTDESMNLNMACVHPDVDSFILWLEETHEERQIETEKERQIREQQATESITE